MYKVAHQSYVMHSSAQMYALVNDIDAYAEFLPWCADSKIIDRKEDEMVAEICVAFKGINKSFTTRNKLFKDEKIVMQLQDGPFSELYGVWEFKSLRADACKISLLLQFDFSNILVEKIFAPVFKYIGDSMVGAFVKRADEIYINKE